MSEPIWGIRPLGRLASSLSPQKTKYLGPGPPLRGQTFYSIFPGRIIKLVLRPLQDPILFWLLVEEANVFSSVPSAFFLHLSAFSLTLTFFFALYLLLPFYFRFLSLPLTFSVWHCWALCWSIIGNTRTRRDGRT